MIRSNERSDPVQDHREEEFLAGLAILAPFFQANDFELKVLPSVAEEEGTRFSAQFSWGNHAVTLVQSASLGPVTYSIGGWSLEHTAYLEAMGVQRGATFPACRAGEGDSALAGYSALLVDLERLIRPFFEEPDREFIELATAAIGRE